MASKATILLLLLGQLVLPPALGQQNGRRFGSDQGARVAQPQDQPQQSNWQKGTQRVQDSRKPLDVEVVDFQRRETNVPTRPPPVYSYMDRFSSKFFQKIVATKGGGNLAYSPVSVHSLLGLIYGASVGKTASELQRAGEFVEEALNVAMDFERLIRHKEHLQGAELTMVSKMYYNQQLGGVNPSYIPFAETYYDAGIEAVDMSRGNDAAAKINAWVADSTRNKIRSLVKPNDIDTQTQTVLVNAIYFKGRWENEFATMDTLPSKFQHSDGSSSSVAMMYNDDVFAMADLPELGATALELAYRDSATSMLLLLPKQVGGLHALEQQLARPEFDLNRIAARLRRQTVTVRLPRFRIEFEQDMTEPLKQLGVRQMFAPNSQVIKMLNAPVRVEKILQKAYVDVGEAGTEASAASYAKFVPLSLPVKSPEFTADHPFVFAIRTPNSVLFMGHVEYPTLMAEGTDQLSQMRPTADYNMG